MNNDEFEKLLLECCGGCEDGDGIEVFMQNLAKVHEYSGEVMGMVQSHEELEDWIEDKISKASQALSDVKHYLEYRSTAYAVQQHGAGPMPDNGERLPVMTQAPEMTPPSSMSLSQALMPPTEDESMDYGDYGGGEAEVEVVVDASVEDPMSTEESTEEPEDDDEILLGGGLGE
jgi:hypothetical protein